MTTHTRTSMSRVWLATAAIFIASVVLSRTLTQRESAMPAYWVGLVGLLSVAVALGMSWHAIGRSETESPTLRRILRGAVACAGLLWLMAMLFPFL